MTIVKGDVFVIPNLAFRLCDDIAESTRDDIRTSLANVGIEVSDTEELVQVWYRSAECDNWACHPWKAFPKFFGSHGIPERLPLGLLKEVKEGDTLEMQWVGGPTIVITAAQLEGRYARFGRFEEVLEKITRK